MCLVWCVNDWCYLEVGEGCDGFVLLGLDYKVVGLYFVFYFCDCVEVDVIYDCFKVQGVYVGVVYDYCDGMVFFYLKDLEGNWFEMFYEFFGGIFFNCN